MVRRIGLGGEADRELERHGEYAAVGVGFQAAGGDEVFGAGDEAWNVEPLGPVGAVGREGDPLVVGEVLEVDDVEAEVAGEVEDALLFHDGAGAGRPAGLAQGDGAGAALLELADEGGEGVVVGGGGRVVGGIEVGLEDDVAAVDVGEVEEPERAGDAGAAVGSADECDAAARRGRGVSEAAEAGEREGGQAECGGTEEGSAVEAAGVRCHGASGAVVRAARAASSSATLFLRPSLAPRAIWC